MEEQTFSYQGDVALAVRLALPPDRCVEDLHLQVSAPCRAHKQERAEYDDSALWVRQFLEAASGFEPENGGFADLI
jgi:hypothetical protein